jgi:hypothetical protein
MNKKYKFLLNSISTGLLSVIFFFVAYIGYEKQHIDLSACDQFEGVIIDKGIDVHYGSKGHKAKVFYISLKDLNEDLGIYRISRNYDDLLKKLTIGDRVKVYYLANSNDRENINIDLIQVDKEGTIIIDKNEYETKEGSLLYIGLIAGFFIIFLLYRDYKYRR